MVPRWDLIAWIVGGVIVLEVLMFMDETELRLRDLERLAVAGPRKPPPKDEE